MKTRTNEDRATCGNVALTAYVNTNTPEYRAYEDLQAQGSDLICDLLHHLHAEGVDLSATLRTAVSNFRCELAEAIEGNEGILEVNDHDFPGIPLAEFDTGYPEINPENCAHVFSYSGTAYGGDDESYHGEGRCICTKCGADGDA